MVAFVAADNEIRIMYIVYSAIIAIYRNSRGHSVGGDVVMPVLVFGFYLERVQHPSPLSIIVEALL